MGLAPTQRRVSIRPSQKTKHPPYLSYGLSEAGSCPSELPQVQQPQRRAWLFLQSNTTSSSCSRGAPMGHGSLSRSSVGFLTRSTRVLVLQQPQDQLNPLWDLSSGMNPFHGTRQHWKALPRRGSPAIFTAAQAFCASTAGYRHSNGLGEHAERVTSRKERHLGTQRADGEHPLHCTQRSIAP